jgi:hypothetical protein
MAVLRILRVRRVRGSVMRTVIGHFTWIPLARRCSISILNDTYSFISDHSECPSYLISKVKAEFRCVAGIIPLLRVPLRAPWRPEILCSDSSEYGFGVCRREIDSEVAEQIGRWAERLRYQAESTGLARTDALSSEAAREALVDNTVQKLRWFQSSACLEVRRCRAALSGR